MLRVGLTGGVGSGKSTVAAWLASLGAVVIDADRIAREVVEPGTPGHAAVVAEFGPEVLADDGSLNRRALARIVFADETRRQALNAIVHPLVAQRRGELAARLPADAVVVEDIPLLVENGLGAAFHLVLVVHAPPEERVRRLAAERGMTPEDARARIKAQADDDARRAAADVWIDNSGSVDATRAAVTTLWVERLVPFERNLRAGRRAPRAMQPVLADPDPTWPEQAARLTGRLRHAVGDRAIRIDHIGSTAVPGLPAKDLLDIQVVVADMETAADVAVAASAAGFVRVTGPLDSVDRSGAPAPEEVAVDADPGRPVNVNIRPEWSPVWRDALLFRDWLRADATGRAEYAALKHELATRPGQTVEGYGKAKLPWIRAALERAESWAARTGWSP